MTKNKIITRLLKLIAILLILDLVQALCVGSVWYMSDLQARNAMAGRLNIESSWQSLENYIEAHFSVGMTRDEVLKQADEIGLSNINFVFIGQMYCETYSFSLGPFLAARGGRWEICYDQNENVISVERVLSA
jgi:hypothetical protein